MESQRHGGESAGIWLTLMIGNSRMHWALFVEEKLTCSWDTEYLPSAFIHQISQCQTLENLYKVTGGESGDTKTNFYFPTAPLPLLLASVVPSQTVLWQTYPNVRIITLDQVPLQGLYSTLGIDRALSIWGAGQAWGFPVLVIDAGTALTFTGANGNQCLQGGAILPGLGLQLATLAQNTGQLPNVEAPSFLPPRFALNTEEAIQSGVIYTLLAGIKDFVEAWWRDYPKGKIAITGGDRQRLIDCLQIQFPEIAARLLVEPNLIFWGMQALIASV
ncbi:MAG: pantothenate kinase [Rhizonema sp. NSF051]|nr:pantothenate kinase [Rhizonema sp. NSF051]